MARVYQRPLQNKNEMGKMTPRVIRRFPCFILELQLLHAPLPPSFAASLLQSRLL